VWIRPQQVAGHPELGDLAREATAAELLRRPGVSYAGLMAVPGAGPGVDDGAIAEQIEIQARYSGYIERQQAEIERHRHHEDMPLPEAFDFAAVHGLSHEVRQKLAAHRPATIGQASRLSGVTPAAISLLLVHLRRRSA